MFLAFTFGLLLPVAISWCPQDHLINSMGRYLPACKVCEGGIFKWVKMATMTSWPVMKRRIPLSRRDPEFPPHKKVKFPNRASALAPIHLT
jgi:hypothetical protein